MSSEVTSGVEFLTLYVTTLPIAVTEDLAITTDIPAVVRVPSLIINENDIKIHYKYLLYLTSLESAPADPRKWNNSNSRELLREGLVSTKSRFAAKLSFKMILLTRKSTRVGTVMKICPIGGQIWK